jgi:hypothetical protein
LLSRKTTSRIFEEIQKNSIPIFSFPPFGKEGAQFLLSGIVPGLVEGGTLDGFGEKLLIHKVVRTIVGVLVG